MIPKENINIFSVIDKLPSEIVIFFFCSTLGIFLQRETVLETYECETESIEHKKTLEYYPYKILEKNN